MKLKIPFVAAAVYFGLVAIGHLVAPVEMSAGVVLREWWAFSATTPPYSSGSGPLNWLARNAEPSPARRATVLANIMAFGLAAILAVVAVARGAGLAGLVPATINLAIATALATGRGAMLISSAPDRRS